MLFHSRENVLAPIAFALKYTPQCADLMERLIQIHVLLNVQELRGGLNEMTIFELMMVQLLSFLAPNGLTVNHSLFIGNLRGRVSLQFDIELLFFYERCILKNG